MKDLNLILYSKYAYIYIILNQQICLSYSMDLYYTFKSRLKYIFSIKTLWKIYTLLFLLYLDNSKPDPVMYYLTKEKIYEGFLFNILNKILKFLFFFNFCELPKLIPHFVISYF
jgi:hypothetical protein